MYSTEGEIDIAPRRCGPGPGMHLKFGDHRAPCLLCRMSRVFEAVDVFEKIGGKMFGFDELVER